MGSIYCTSVMALCLLLNETITTLMHAWLCKVIPYAGENIRLNFYGKFALFKIKLEKKAVQVHLRGMQEQHLTCETGC